MKTDDEIFDQWLVLRRRRGSKKRWPSWSIVGNPGYSPSMPSDCPKFLRCSRRGRISLGRNTCGLQRLGDRYVFVAGRTAFIRQTSRSLVARWQRDRVQSATL